VSTHDLHGPGGHAPDLRDRRVLVVDSNRKQLRSLERVLKSVVGTVEARDVLDDIPDDGAFDLIALSYDMLTAEKRTRLIEQLSGSTRTRLMLFSGGAWEKDHRELFDERLLTNLLAKNGEEVGADELLVTINKILARDIFGLEKYFPWGSGVVRLSTCRSEEKDRIVDQARDFARNLGVNDRLATYFAVVTDELLTNALYNAPIDDKGVHLYAARDRAVPVVLEPSQAIEVKFCSDGRKIGVSVADPFGSLTADIVLDYLAKCLRREEDQVDKKAGGAGLGLFQAFGSVSHLVLNISAGHRCEAIGMIDVRGSFKDFVMQAKSFNIFVEEKAR
jgi:hypothetical protein